MNTQTRISNKVEGLDTTLLPVKLLEIVAAIGLPSALRLVESFGGTRIFVPAKENCTPEHLLSRLIGFAALLDLADYRGGEQLELPMGKAALRAIRDIEIRTRSASHSQSQLALMYGLTERQIRNILSGHIEEDKQQALFN